MNFTRSGLFLSLAFLGLTGCASQKPSAPTPYDFVVADAQRRAENAAPEPAVASDALRAQARVDVAVAQYEVGNYERASVAAEEAVVLDAQNSAAWLMNALSKEKLRQPPSTVASFYEQVYRKFPLNADVQHNFGLFLCQSAQTRARGFDLLSLATQNPQNRGLGRTLLASAKCAPTSANGIEFSLKALDAFPQWGEAWLVLGELYSKEQRWDSAQQALIKHFSFTDSPGTDALHLGIRIADARNDAFQANQYRERLNQLAPHRNQTLSR